MLPAETTKALMEWEPINARLITARFYGSATNISVVQEDAPTNDVEPEEKEKFYAALQGTIDKLPREILLSSCVTTMQRLAVTTQEESR